MRCAKCGLESKSSGNFCEHCGAPRNDQGRMQTVAQAPGALPDGAVDPAARASSAARACARALSAHTVI